MATRKSRLTSVPSPPACPTCGSAKDVVPIVFGLPGPDLLADAERGEVILGGCVLPEHPPAFHCRACRADLPPT